MRGRILETDLSVPYRLRGYLYFTKTVEGKQYPYHYRRRDPLHATVPGGVREGEPVREELLLDLNQLAEGHSFLGLDAFEISDDSHWLAFSTDTTGFRQYTLYLKDLRTGETLPGRFERSEEHTSELQSRLHLVCRLLLAKKTTSPPRASPITSSRSSCRASASACSTSTGTSSSRRTRRKASRSRWRTCPRFMNSRICRRR